MSARKSAFWRGFDKVERAVGKPLEDVVASQKYVDVSVLGMKVKRGIGGAAQRIVGRPISAVLRAANVPTRGDVQRLSRQLSGLTSEVRALSAKQAEGAGRPVEDPGALPPGRPDSGSTDGR